MSKIVSRSPNISGIPKVLEMKSAFRLQETLYLEVSPERGYPILPAGRVVPATWAQTFTTFAENQRSIDLHLLRGNSERIAECTTLGKWRIGGIPPSAQGEHRIRVEVRAGADGGIGLRASLDDDLLPVILLTEAFPKLPLTFRVPTIPAETLVSLPCPVCHHRFVVRATNWRNEPFALCLDCGHEFDLPDAGKSEETAPWDDLPPELIETLGIEPPHRPGGLDDESLRELREKGFEIPSLDDPQPRLRLDKVLEQIPKMMFSSRDDGIALDVDDILHLAGEPLPEDQRRKCPHCDAVIARDAERCEWCGQEL